MEDGVPLLEYRLLIPSVDGAGKGVTAIRNFYENMARAYVAHAARPLLARGRGLYENCEEKRRRFTFCRLLYTHDYEVTANEEGLFSCKREIMLRQKGRVLWQQSHAETFSLATGHLLPLPLFVPRAELRKVARQYRQRPRRLRRASFFVRGNRVFVLLQTDKGTQIVQFPRTEGERHPPIT